MARWARFDTELPEPPPTPALAPGADAGVLLLATCWAVSWLAVRWVVQPLRVLAQAAQSLGEDLTRPPLPEDGPTEVRQADAGLQHHAAAAGAVHRRAHAHAHRAVARPEDTADAHAAAHRTAGRRRGATRASRPTCKEMETMVTQTLDFMRGLGGHEPARPGGHERAAAGLQTDQQAMGRSVVVEGRALQPYVGVPTLLRRALGNLVDNAVLYGGSATLQVDDTPDRADADRAGRRPRLPRPNSSASSSPSTGWKPHATAPPVAPAWAWASCAASRACTVATWCCRTAPWAGWKPA
jgi:signal transduction histidine kinase